MFKPITFLKAWKSTRKAGKMTPTELKALQSERLATLIKYARENSRFYRDAYASLPDAPTLKDLPPVNKRELMTHFNDWITDPTIKLDDLHAFVKRTDNIGQPYLGKYLVCTTSGSTGVPAIYMYDKSNLNVLDSLAITRSIAYKGIMMKLVKAGGRSAAVYATGGHYLGVASVKYKQFKNPLKAKQFKVLSVLSPVEDIVNEMNKFQPALLGGYPTALELLIREKEAGRLNIHPVLINTGGEYLSKELANQLSKTFGCPVQTSYSCTEGGLMAFQCSEGHLHVNTDWTIIEPVDVNGKAVPQGALSDKLYLTNLANFIQPVIRYEVTDRVRMFDKPCACGSHFPTIEVEGRTDDMLIFDIGTGVVQIPPLALYVVMKEVPGMFRFQLIQKDNNRLLLKLETKASRDIVATEAKKRLEAFLLSKGVKPLVEISPELPAPAASGKFRHVMRQIPQSD